VNQDKATVMAFWAIWNDPPLATAIGWPEKFPNHARVADPSVMSSDTIDHGDPELFVHDRPATIAGRVTLLPPADAEDDVVIADPPAVYPVPVISVPAADAVEAVEFSRIFIWDADSAVHVPGCPADAPVGSVAFRMLLIMPLAIAANVVS
jgi:hypothetical protein